MAGKSSIEWTGHTWNPLAGCSVLTPGCTNCYAMKMAARLEAMGQELYAGLTKPSKAGPVWTGVMRQAPDSVLLAPLRRKKPTTYFVNSMSDLFHENVPDEWIDQVFAIMALTPQHTYQVLTKRPERMRDYFTKRQFRDVHPLEVRGDAISDAMDKLAPAHWCKRELQDYAEDGLPLPNVWLGVSTERQKEADERIPLLLQTPAAVRFISAEPLLGPIDLTRIAVPRTYGSYLYDAVGGIGRTHAGDMFPSLLDTLRLDWVIVGGESGHDARPMHPDWARGLRDQCAAAGVAYFFKQWGEWAPSTPEEAFGNPRSGWCTLRAHPRIAKAEELYPEAGAAFIEHKGKKAAGRLLDGITWDQMPGGTIAENG